MQAAGTLVAEGPRAKNAVLGSVGLGQQSRQAVDIFGDSVCEPLLALIECGGQGVAVSLSLPSPLSPRPNVCLMLLNSLPGVLISPAGSLMISWRACPSRAVTIQVAAVASWGGGRGGGGRAGVPEAAWLPE